MSSNERKMPKYQMIDGMRIADAFSREAYLSALTYKPRDDDLFIVTYPKCGTTWVQNIVGNIYREGVPYQSALEFLSATPFLEMAGVKAAETMKRPGAIKLHLPFHLTPYSPTAKYIFVARNPKDCCVSFYYHTTNIALYDYENGEFDDYFELFINGEVDFGNYFDTLLSWYEHRNDPNVLFITYEELKRDTENQVIRIAEFMGSQYKIALETQPEFMESVLKHSSINYMREFLNSHLDELDDLPRELFLDNPDVPEGIKKLYSQGRRVYSWETKKSQFVRKGIVGDWRNHFSKDQNARMDKIFRERTEGTDIPELWKDDMH